MMRLTLRTLLAYLDDVLSPADTKIIGQKIQESPMAQILVSRIREVMRRRRLKAPELFGPEMGVDPNIVCQYLDNTLPPDQYADVERVLLASDELLAETAACHQVLTLLLGEPKEVSAASRERLYALGPVEASSQLAVPPETSIGAKSRTPHSVSTQTTSLATHDASAKTKHPVEERVTTVPDYLRPAPLWKRLLPTAIVVVLFGVCLALLIPVINDSLQRAKIEMEQNLARNNQSSREGTPEATTPAENSVAAADSKSVDLSVPEVSLPTTQGKTDSNSEVGLKLPEGLDPAPPKDDADEPASASNPATETANTNSPPTPPPPGQEPEVVPPAPAASAPIPAERIGDFSVAYTSTEGVLARLDPVRRNWFVAPHRSDLKPGDRIACFDPFDATLEFEKAGVRATLVGECVIELLAAAGMQGMGIGRGRILLQSRPKTDAEKGTIAIAIGEDLWKLELQSSGAVCALDVVVKEPTQFEKFHDYRWYQASLYVLSGSVQLTNRAGQSREIGPLSEMILTPSRAPGAASEPMPMSSSPEWCDAPKRRQQPLRRYQSIFEKSFDVDRPVEESMVLLVTNGKNPKIEELAVRSLSAIDNFPALVQALAECPHEEGRSAARDGIRQWLPMNPANGPILKAALLTRFSEVDAEAVYRLLWGFTRDEVKDSKTNSRQFTDWMRSQHQEIRELADYWVERLTGRSTEFKALSPLSQRETQVKRIEAQIERDNGLIRGQ